MFLFFLRQNAATITNDVANAIELTFADCLGMLSIASVNMRTAKGADVFARMK